MRYRLFTALAAAGVIATLGFTAAAEAQEPPCPYGGGYGSGYGMMGGYGPGWMMGYPHGYMMGPGHGGWGGYHHGWMGGSGYGSGPGGYQHGWMMGSGNGPGYGPGPGASQGQRNLDLSTDDVTAFLQRMIRNPNLKVGDVKVKDADTITAQVVTKKDNSLVQTFEFNRHSGFYQPEP